jgi:hypothetical protein
MGRGIAAISIIAAAALFAGISASQASSSQPLRPGDVLKYDIAIELQFHVIPAPHSTQPPVNVETSVLGTATLSALRTDADGTVHASVDVATRSSTTGQTQRITRGLLVKIAPQGSIQVERGGDAATAQYLKMIGDSASLCRYRTLHVGDTFAQEINFAAAGLAPMTLTTQAKVVAKKVYRGFPTFAVQLTGNGNIDTQIQGARVTGTVTFAGTKYCDQDDQLLIGDAVRSNVDATMSSEKGQRLSAVATINIILDSRTRAALRNPQNSPTPAAPSPVPSVAPTPTPIPPPQYYTPTPPGPTPSPVVNPYPPSF